MDCRTESIAWLLLVALASAHWAPFAIADALPPEKSQAVATETVASHQQADPHREQPRCEAPTLSRSTVGGRGARLDQRKRAGLHLHDCPSRADCRKLGKHEFINREDPARGASA